ncbi:MAG: methyltransferase domain-containing protein [Sulfurimonadaceae bacterium]|jgi:malonyl-CoA O-methyltransferase|nr:methyltransferase domain-containing protein [Sulfurimonadaceae bacterium]
MKISTEFSKYATHYGTYNIIQNQVVQKLLSLVKNSPLNILDLGCGEGAICKQIEWEYQHFTGIDFAPNMLSLHPKSKNIETLFADFNQAEIFDKLKEKKFDAIFSASALQWADDLESVLKHIKNLESPIALAIFSANTFRTLHKTAGIDGVLRTNEEIVEIAKRYFDVDVEIVEYQLSFLSVRDMFRYIKKSGVSGSRKVLSYKKTKELMKNYPLDYLEFEVVFLISR